MGNASSFEEGHQGNSNSNNNSTTGRNGDPNDERATARAATIADDDDDDDRNNNNNSNHNYAQQFDGIETLGYRVLGVQPNSPASVAGLVSFLDFIVGANEQMLLGSGEELEDGEEYDDVDFPALLRDNIGRTVDLRECAKHIYIYISIYYVRSFVRSFVLSVSTFDDGRDVVASCVDLLLPMGRGLTDRWHRLHGVGYIGNCAFFSSFFPLLTHNNNRNEP